MSRDHPPLENRELPNPDMLKPIALRAYERMPTSHTEWRDAPVNHRWNHTSDDS